MTSTAGGKPESDTYSIKLLPAAWARACEAYNLDTDAKIARHLRISPPTVYRTLTGMADPSPMFIASACKRLGRDFGQLFTFYIKAAS